MVPGRGFARLMARRSRARARSSLRRPRRIRRGRRSRRCPQGDLFCTTKKQCVASCATSTKKVVDCETTGMCQAARPPASATRRILVQEPVPGGDAECKTACKVCTDCQATCRAPCAESCPRACRSPWGPAPSRAVTRRLGQRGQRAAQGGDGVEPRYGRGDPRDRAEPRGPPGPAGRARRSGGSKPAAIRTRDADHRRGDAGRRRASPGNSYLLYKMAIRSSATGEAAARQPEEIARLRSSVVVGLPMPPMQGTPVTEADLLNLANWISVGAPTPACF